MGGITLEALFTLLLLAIAVVVWPLGFPVLAVASSTVWGQGGSEYLAVVPYVAYIYLCLKLYDRYEALREEGNVEKLYCLGKAYRKSLKEAACCMVGLIVFGTIVGMMGPI